MPRVHVSVVIDAQPAVVWAAVEDIASHVDWMLDARAIRFTSPQRAGVGTTFDCATKVGPFRLTDRMEIVRWEPRRAMYVRHSGLITGTGGFTLERARRARTRFVWDEPLRFPWYFGGPIGALAAKPVLTAIWKRSLANLKAKVESGSGP